MLVAIAMLFMVGGLGVALILAAGAGDGDEDYSSQENGR